MQQTQRAPQGAPCAPFRTDEAFARAHRFPPRHFVVRQKEEGGRVEHDEGAQGDKSHTGRRESNVHGEQFSRHERGVGSVAPNEERNGGGRAEDGEENAEAA